MLHRLTEAAPRTWASCGVLKAHYVLFRPQPHREVTAAASDCREPHWRGDTPLLSTTEVLRSDALDRLPHVWSQFVG